MERFLVCLVLTLSLSAALPPEPSSTVDPLEPRAESDPASISSEEPPEGYYAFVESPNATPPRVRPPPYRQVGSPCPDSSKAQVSANNLCGDLNRGSIPRNPMGQSPGGEPYPFELIRNHTLRFLSKTLPVLKADETLPRVAHLSHYTTTDNDLDLQTNGLEQRMKRAAPPAPQTDEHKHREEARESKGFCDGGGVFCMLYRAINGGSAAVERREDPGTVPPHPHPQHPRYEGPPTPCPARVEYATPVFARNYQGVWRYVVQIPYEGYFTQTVEVTRCLQSRCHYLEGGCLSSPRWVSLLVAEMHYPQQLDNLPPEHYQAGTPSYQQRPNDSSQQYQPSQQLRHKRDTSDDTLRHKRDTGDDTLRHKRDTSDDTLRHKRDTGDDTNTAQGRSEAEGRSEGNNIHCDGHDELGCYQVRLYYDWFLVPGSCKCWRPDYFARYVRRRQTTNEL